MPGQASSWHIFLIFSNPAAAWKPISFSLPLATYAGYLTQASIIEAKPLTLVYDIVGVMKKQTYKASCGEFQRRIV